MATEHILPLDWQIPLPRGKIGWILRPYREVVETLARMDRHCRTCAEQINRGGFDVLLAHSCQFFRSTPIGRYVDVPSFLYQHEPYRWLYEAWPRLPWVALPPSGGRPSIRYLKSFLRDLINVQALRVQMREELASVGDFDMILVNSLFSRESVLRAYGLDSKVCYLGIDTEAFRPTDASKEGFVVGLGNIFDNKGLDVAVASLGTIEEAWRPDLVWIGNFAHPPYLQRIEELARGLGVRFLPKVNIPHAEMVHCLRKSEKIT